MQKWNAVPAKWHRQLKLAKITIPAKESHKGFALCSWACKSLKTAPSDAKIYWSWLWKSLSHFQKHSLQLGPKCQHGIHDKLCLVDLTIAKFSAKIEIEQARGHQNKMLRHKLMPKDCQSTMENEMANACLEFHNQRALMATHDGELFWKGLSICADWMKIT